MELSEIEDWCKINNYEIIDMSRDHLLYEDVIKIAIKATNIDRIFKENQQHEHSLARFLAMSYLDAYYPTGTLANKFGVNYTVVSHARNMELMSCDIKYYKKWQQTAILYFRERITYLHNELKKRNEEKKRNRR